MHKSMSLKYELSLEPHHTSGLAHPLTTQIFFVSTILLSSSYHGLCPCITIEVSGAERKPSTLFWRPWSLGNVRLVDYSSFGVASFFVQVLDLVSSRNRDHEIGMRFHGGEPSEF